MCAKKDVAELKDKLDAALKDVDSLGTTLRVVMDRGYNTIFQLHKAAQDIEQSESENKVMRIDNCTSMVMILNDIMSFAHDWSLKVYPEESHPFIKQCMRQQELAVKDAPDGKKVINV